MTRFQGAMAVGVLCAIAAHTADSFWASLVWSVAAVIWVLSALMELADRR